MRWPPRSTRPVRSTRSSSRVAGGASAAHASSQWERTLAEHSGIVSQLHADASWARAAADYAALAERPVRLVTLTDATTRRRTQPSPGRRAARPVGTGCHP